MILKHLWATLVRLPSDFEKYGGSIVRNGQGDCSSGCRWARYLEDSGDWLVCVAPEWVQLPSRSRAWLSYDAPRRGLLTWEHQAGAAGGFGAGCYEWVCEDCGKGADGCRCLDDDDSVEMTSPARPPVAVSAADADAVLEAVRFYRSVQSSAVRHYIRNLLRGVTALLSLLGGDSADKLAGPLQSTAAFLEELEQVTVFMAADDARRGS